MIYRCGTRENAPKKAQPSEGSFDEVEPEGYASSRAGFSTWIEIRSQGSGVMSESEYGVGNLTHTAYANQRMTLNSEIAKISSSKVEYDDRAT